MAVSFNQFTPATRISAAASTHRLAQRARCQVDAIDDFPEDAQLAVGLLAEAISLEPQWLGKAMSDSDLDRIRSRSEFRSVIRSAVRLQTAARHARRNQQDGETSTERESAETGE